MVVHKPHTVGHALARAQSLLDLNANQACRLWLFAQDSWQPVPTDSDAVTMGMAAGAQEEVTLCVEPLDSTGAGPWDSFLREITLPEILAEGCQHVHDINWAMSRRVGDYLDALDSENTWLAGVITEIRYDSAGVCALVRFDGWSKQYNEWIKLYSQVADPEKKKQEVGVRAAPLFAHSKPWRHALAAQSKLEVALVPLQAQDPNWFVAFVEKVDTSELVPRVKLASYTEETASLLAATETAGWFRADDLSLAKLGTHHRDQEQIRSACEPPALRMPAATSSGASGPAGSKSPSAKASSPTHARTTEDGMPLTTVPKVTSSSRSGRKLSSSMTGWFARRSHRGGVSIAPGIVGLDNLGNTCFMNSTLQCLIATMPLTKYFLAGNWKRDVNSDNPLGSHGDLAAAYADLVADAWSGEHSCLSPHVLKQVLARNFAQFAGYAQQDSQEFMSALLDGLHEDLNRVKKKPYVEDVESDGRPDTIVAREAWHRYKLRNDSVVADTFCGQLRSHVKCNVCERESTTFDPFMTLTVPISERESKKTLIFTFCPADPTLHPVRYRSYVPKFGVMQDIIDWLCECGTFPLPADERQEGEPPLQHAQLKPDELVVALVDSRSGSIRELLPRQFCIGDIAGDDWVYVYQVPNPGTAAAAEAVQYWEAKDKRAEMARRAARSDKAFEFDSDEDEQELMAYRYIHNKPWVVELQMHVPTSRAMLLMIPELVPRAALTVDGTWDGRITGDSLGRAVWARTLKYLQGKPEDLDEQWNAACPLYTLFRRDKHAKRSTFSKSTDAVQLPVSGDDEVDIDPNDHVLRLRWSASNEEPPYAPADTDEGAALQPVPHRYLMSKVEDTSRPASREDHHESLEKHDFDDIHQCLSRFTQHEQLGADDMWYCPTCREHRQAFKKMDLYTLPNILVIHLKRFQVTNYGRSIYSYLQRDKLVNEVRYPLTGLNLSEYVQGPQDTEHIYDCFAVSDHSGSLGGGHYTGFVRAGYDGNWYSTNDSSVRPARASHVVSRYNYLLFYKRRTESGMTDVEFLDRAAHADAAKYRTEPPNLIRPKA